MGGFGMMQVILASTSPRRRELLSVAGVEFEVMAADIDETWQTGESAKEYIIRMVQNKAVRATSILSDDGNHTQNPAMIITADTIGVIDDEVLTKPINKPDAFAMWRKMSGRAHEVWTAVCVSIVENGMIRRQKHVICSTQVYFVPLTDEMKERYWQTGEPADKAGAYAIQGGAMAWVERIDGSYTNVVGLPLAQTLALMNEMQAHVE